MKTLIAFAARLVRCDDNVPEEEQHFRCTAARVIRDCHSEIEQLRFRPCCYECPSDATCELLMGPRQCCAIRKIGKAVRNRPKAAEAERGVT